MRALGFVVFLSITNLVHADPIPPNEIGLRVFGVSKYESDDLASYRFNVRTDWGKGVRLNLGPGANFHLGNEKYALYENRYFFLNSTHESVLRNLDVRKIFAGKKEITFAKYEVQNGVTSFNMILNKSSFLATIVISCIGESELSGLNKARNSDFYRFQIHLKKCVINGSTTLLENSWMTFDAFQFDGVASKSALVLRGLHFNEAMRIEGKAFSNSDVANLVLGVEDEVLLSLFGKLGYKLNKAMLWRHQP